MKHKTQHKSKIEKFNFKHFKIYEILKYLAIYSVISIKIIFTIIKLFV
jgi:hypothetical protein